MATVTIPIENNISKDTGTVLLRVHADLAIESQESIFLVGNYLLSLDKDKFILTTKEKDLSISFILEASVFPGEVTLLWSWDNGAHRLLAFNEATEEVYSKVFMDTSEATDIGIDIKEDYEKIHLAIEPFFTGSFKELLIFQTDYVYEPDTPTNISRFREEEFVSFQADYTKPTHYVSRPIIETTMAPRDASPILLKDNKGYMNRQFFFDKYTGEYADTNTEEFIYRGEDEVYLSYKEIDKNYGVFVVFENNETFKLNYSKEELPLTYQDETLRFYFNEQRKEEWYGLSYSVTYQIERSYNVEYNEDSSFDGMKINLVNHQNTELTLLQEGNRFSNQFLAKEIELNPLVNSLHTGFLYIDKEIQKTQAFRLNVSSSYLTADGSDTADFIIEAIDEEGNTVLNPFIDVHLLGEDGRVATGLGELIPIINKETMKARRTSGRMYYKYQAPFIRESDNPITQRIFLVAYDRVSNLGAQIPIFVRPYHKEEAQRVLPETLVEAGLPFEVFSRHYGAELIEGHYANLLDFNKDGVLDELDFEVLLREKNNQSFMATLEASIRIKMGYKNKGVSIESNPVLLTGLTQNYIIG